MGNITDEPTLVSEVGGEGLCLGELSASVATYIDDESVAQSEAIEHDADVAVANAILEGFAAHVANVVVEDDVFES